MLILNPIFSNGMIMQANKPISVFGTGAGKITLSFLGNTRTVDSAKESWCITLPAQNYGGPYTMEITLDGENSSLRTFTSATCSCWQVSPTCSLC